MALAGGGGIKRLRSMDVLGWVNYVSPEDPSEEHVPWQRRDTCPMAIRNAWVRGDQKHQEVQRWFLEGQGDKRRVVQGQALYIYGEDKAVQITMLAISRARPRIRS